MKRKIQLTPKAKPSIRLRTAFIFGASFFLLANLVGFIAYFYFSAGSPENTMAAPPATNISGVINSYLRVTAINSGTRVFTADNLSGSSSDFAVGKTVMIYQAQGATITTSSGSTYGTVTASNNSGNYEFAVISASANAAGTYTITVSTLSNNYTASGAVQLISVPSYTDATVTGTVTATAWSSAQGRGGIVALQVSNVLTLGANIDVSGQGFAGGQINPGNDDCPDADTYRSNTNTFGTKGNGISTDGRLYARGAQANGGGGGNPHNAGGGGGSNSTRGGFGGDGYQPGGGCANADGGGIAGNKFNYASLGNKIYFGGGGGSGHQNNSVGSSGANGGGIIVVRAKTVKSTCSGTYGFLSNGNNAANAASNDGAGGGGAGGSIVLDVTSYVLTCTINVRANGGNGGNVNHTDAHGGGGGAGIGITLQTSPTSNASVSISSTPGTNGNDCSGSSCTFSGTAPETPTTYTLSVSSIPGQTITLPIELASFTGEAVNNSVELKWQTASEENNDYFTLEHSANGTDFTAFTEIKGAGTSKKMLYYSTTDEAYFPKVTYYRLKQTDYDEKFTYSSVIYVDTHSLKREMLLYPNPASDIVNVTNPGDGDLTVRFLNSRGVVVKSEVVNEPKAVLDVTSLEEGIYMVETISGSQKMTHKLMIKR